MKRINEEVYNLIVGLELAFANEIDKGNTLSPGKVASTTVCFAMQEVASILEQTLDWTADQRYDLAQNYKQQVDELRKAD